MKAQTFRNFFLGRTRIPAGTKMTISMMNAADADKIYGFPLGKCHLCILTDGRTMHIPATYIKITEYCRDLS